MAVNLYTTCSVLTVGCPVYTDSGRTTPAGNGQYYDGTTCWTISGGIITGTGTCAPYSCGGGTVTGTYSGSNYHLYVDRTISTTSNPISIISWDAISRPNRFSVYDNNGLITSSGWVGTANYAGPWGASLSTPSTGNIYFTFATTNGRYVRVEAGPADPGNPTSDSYSWNLSCVTTTTTTSTTTTTTTAAPTTTTSTTTTTTTSTPTGYITIQNVSLNVPITNVTIGGVSVSYSSGTNFPVNAGENGTFSTTQIGSYAIRVYYGSNISGQHITITDSSLASTCCNLNPGGGLCLANPSDIDTTTAVQIDVADGTC